MGAVVDALLKKKQIDALSDQNLAQIPNALDSFQQARTRAVLLDIEKQKAQAAVGQMVSQSINEAKKLDITDRVANAQIENLNAKASSDAIKTNAADLITQMTQPPAPEGGYNPQEQAAGVPGLVEQTAQRKRLGMMQQYGLLPSKGAAGVAAGVLQIPEGLKTLPKTASDAEKEQFLSNFSDADQELIKGLADYSLDPSKVSSIRSNAREATIKAAKMFNPSFDMNKFTQRKRFMESLADTTSGKMGYNVLSLNTLMGHLNLLEDQVPNLKNKSLTPVNMVVNFAKQLTGNPNITTFDEAKSVVDSELERALSGIGATQEGLRIREKLMNKNASPEQMVGAISTLKDIVATRVRNLNGQFKAMMGRDPNPGEIIYDENQGLFDEAMAGGSSVGSGTTKSGKSYADYLKAIGR